MATLVTLGLSKILGKVGEPTALNFTETGYTAFGLTYEDTCKMSQEEPRPPRTKTAFRGRNSFRHLELSRCSKYRRGIYYHPSEKRFEVPSSTHETCSQN